MPFRSARTSASATRLVEPEDHGVDGQLHRRAGAEGSEVEDPFGQAVEDRTGALEVGDVTADHDREIAREGRTRRCPRPVHRGSRLPRPRTAGAIDRMVSGRTVLMSTATEPARRPAVTPSGPSYRSWTARVVGDHRDDDVGSRGGIGRRRRHARADPPGKGGRPLRRPVVDDDRDALAGQPLGHRRAHPAGAEDGRRRSRHAASSIRRRTVSTIRSTDGTARSSRAAADGSGMCGVVIRTIGASRL